MPDMDYKTLRREIENIDTLPTLPGILNKLLKVIENPRVSLKEIGNFISNDPVLTSRILRAVNSPIYGFPGRIASINQSLVLLGLNVVRGLLLGVSVFEAMKRGVEGLWEHSVGCATVARIVAQRVGLKEPEEVAVAALLHDIGKVILSLKFPREYRKVLVTVEEKEQFVWEGEKDFFEVTHAEIGAWIAQRWHFPPNLIEIIDCHHKPHLSRQVPQMTAIVHLSDILIRARGFGFAGDAFVPAVNPEVWKTLQLSEADLRSVLSELEDSLDMVGDFLVLD
jgi:putative nucleotidyltransferase with HDIG domain